MYAYIKHTHTHTQQKQILLQVHICIQMQSKILGEIPIILA